jgi:hypothetical protein
MNYIKNIHPDKQELSLMLPFNASMEIYKIDRWDFSEVMEQRDGTFRLTAHCMLKDFKEWNYEWFATDKDIEEYGGGNLDSWKHYVISSFESVLETKKQERLRQISNKLKISMDMFNIGNGS